MAWLDEAARRHRSPHRQPSRTGGHALKRTGDLYNRICSWENMELAARRARRRKRYRIASEDFELRRETILRRVRADLLAGRWRPQGYRCFTIFDPKERTVCAPPYADRVVHHAVCNVVVPVLERSMVPHSYSCREGMGTKAARAECLRHVRRYRYVLKLDVRRFFPSIDHAILKAKFRRCIKCGPTLRLLDDIVDSWCERNQAPSWFPGDDLLAPATRPHGLPIGALTSQWFANFYLTRLDHIIEERVRPGGFVRYTDDLLLFSDSKRLLRDARALLAAELLAERLRPHPTKCRIHRCFEGIPFLGFRFWPDRVRVLRANRRRFERRMAACRRRLRSGAGDLAKALESAWGWAQSVREFPANEGLVRAEFRRWAFSVGDGAPRP